MNLKNNKLDKNLKVVLQNFYNLKKMHKLIVNNYFVLIILIQDQRKDIMKLLNNGVI